MNQTIFLETIKHDVIEDMEKNHILASMTAAQALTESKYGTSQLAVYAKNLFGIKGSYLGQSVKMKTKEFINGKYVNIYANFKKYPSWKQSIQDHSSMFHRLSRYHNLINVKDYKTSCILVKNDGYATDPDYTKTLIKTIETYKLYEWDKLTLEGIDTSHSVPTHSLKINGKGSDVIWLQIALNQHGYNLKVDGIFGKNTLNVVMDYQKKNGLKVDGIAGVKTIAKLCEKE